jgi:hypothetical protein
MTRLIADVKTVTGKTEHLLGAAHEDGRLVGVERIPAPAYVVISEDKDGSFYLFHYNSQNDCIADSWFQSLEQAKRQAKFEFDLDDGDWAQYDDPL